MLNHPRRRQQPIDASAARFPPIGPAAQTPAPLPAPDTAALDAYIATYGGLFERFERESALAERCEEPSAEHAQRRLPPLSTVPQVFFGAEFDLSKQYTFDLVTERYKQTTAVGLSESDTSPYGVVLNQMLQEKLSYYSDVIEQHLVVEIGAKSASFFDALATLQHLGADTAACISQLDALQAHLDEVGQQVADGLRLAALRAERQQLAQQERLLLDMRRLIERRDLLQLLVQHNEFENALAVLEEVRQELERMEPLAALRPLAPQLDEVQNTIGAVLQRELVQVLHDTLAQLPALDVQAAHGHVAVDTALPLAAEHAPVVCKPAMHLVALLRRCHGLPAALETFAASGAERVERLVRTTLEHDDTYAWAAPLVSESQEALQRVYSAAWPSYVTLSAVLFRALLLSARHCAAQDAMLRAATNDMPQAQAFVDAATHAAWARAQRIASHTLAVRTPRLAEQSLDEFVPYFALMWRFVHFVESANDRAVVGLRSAVLAQAKSFLTHFHKTHIERAVRAVEEEVWAPAPVATELATCVAQIVAAGETDLEALRIAPMLGSAPPEVPSKSEASQRTLVLGTQHYFVVRASAVVLELLSDYVRVVINLPVFAAETLGWAVEFLKQYNSRTCQVVLGAGAMRSAGLKNITARHLALASQSLSLMVALIAPLRAVCARHLKPTQSVLLSEFDKLQRDFSEHQLEIHAKLISIMSDRVQVHARALATQDWDALPADDAPSPAVRDLMRETGTLHRVMVQYLEPHVVHTILGKVCQDIDTSFSTALARVDVRAPEAHKRMLTDVEHIGSKMRQLYEPAWKGERLNETVQSKAPAAVRASIDKGGGGATPPLAYRPRFSFGKRPPATQSPRLQAMDAFDGKASERGSLEKPPSERPSMEQTSGRPSPEKLSRTSTPAEDVQPPVPSKTGTPPDAARAPEAGVHDTSSSPMPETETAKAPPPAPTPPPLDTNTLDATPRSPSKPRPMDPPRTPTSASRASLDGPKEAPESGKDAASTGRKAPRSSGRMALQQRLAESMRRRAAQPRTPKSPTKEVSSEVPKEEAAAKTLEPSPFNDPYVSPSYAAGTEQDGAEEAKASEQAPDHGRAKEHDNELKAQGEVRDANATDQRASRNKANDAPSLHDPAPNDKSRDAKELPEVPKKRNTSEEQAKSSEDASKDDERPAEPAEPAGPGQEVASQNEAGGRSHPANDPSSPVQGTGVLHAPEHRSEPISDAPKDEEALTEAGTAVAPAHRTETPASDPDSSAPQDEPPNEATDAKRDEPKEPSEDVPSTSDPSGDLPATALDTSVQVPPPVPDAYPSPPAEEASPNEASGLADAPSAPDTAPYETPASDSPRDSEPGESPHT